MKRFALATLAALAAVVASEQQAKAWFNLGVSTGTTVNLSWGGHQHYRSSDPWPQSCGAPGGCGNNYYGYHYDAAPYGASGWGGYGMPAYGMQGGGYGMPAYGMPGGGYRAPMPGSGSGTGSGSPVEFNLVPVPLGTTYIVPFYPQDIQHAYYEVPMVWYVR